MKVGVTLPVGVAVAVKVGVKVGVILPVEVAVAVEVAVKVGVEVNVGVTETARFRKITIVCEAAVPSTILRLALPAARFLLINRSAGMV